MDRSIGPPAPAYWASRTVLPRVSAAVRTGGIVVVMDANPNLPPRRVTPPNKDRHRIARIDQRTRARATTSVVESWVDLAGDVAAINRGEAIRQGETYYINGRTHRVKANGAAFPVSGDGVH